LGYKAPVTRASKRRLKTIAGSLLIAAALLWPYLWVEIGTRRARECLAAYERPRVEAPGDCLGDLYWFVTPSRIPWTKTAASYRAEEISMRVAIGAFMDAAVGRPSRAGLGRAGEALDRAHKAIRAGSTRVELYELGRAVRTPDLGYYADLVGDRATLLAKGDHWLDWKVRLRTLEAALLEADLTRASILAKGYAGTDPADEDLRVAVAAALCLGGEPERALPLLETVQNDRAKERHAAIARNYGEVRAALVACAAKAGKSPPPKPESSEAGSLDREEVRAALQLRLLAAATGEAELAKRRDAAVGAIDLLGDEARQAAHPYALLAAVLVSGHPVDPPAVATLARTVGKDANRPPAAFASPLDWLPSRRRLAPGVGPTAWRRAAERVASWLDDAKLEADDAAALEQLKRRLWVEAARAHVRDGDADSALAALEASGAFTGDDLALSKASAWYVVGQPGRALEALPAAPTSAQSKASTLALRAELLMSLGRGDDAASSAEFADDAARQSGDAAIEVRARWSRLAISRKSPHRVRTSVDAASLTRPEAWPHVGVLGTGSPWVHADLERVGTLDRALSMWAAAREAKAPDRLAIRHALLSHRTDTPPRSRVAYLATAAGLLAAGEGDVEIWLDAFDAFDVRRAPLRTVAWTRAEAARWRGDVEAAKRWSERYAKLCTWTAEQPELAGILGL
jgi:hypothetical protein